MRPIGRCAQLRKRQFRPAKSGSRSLPPLFFDRGKLDLGRQTSARKRRPRIRCPHCGWQPGRASTWTCLPMGHPEYFRSGCGHSWNTFDTRGLCPGCSHQWLHTSCLACGRWALHEAWYERNPGSGPNALD